MFLAYSLGMPLPAIPRAWVAVKVHDESAHWILNVLPALTLGPPFLGQPDPSLGTVKLGLYVGLVTIRLEDYAILTDHAIGYGIPSRTHTRRMGGGLLKQQDLFFLKAFLNIMPPRGQFWLS